MSERWTDGEGRVNYNHYQYDGGGLCGFVHDVYDAVVGDVRQASRGYAVMCDSYGSVHQVRDMSGGGVVAEYSYDAWGMRSVRLGEGLDGAGAEMFRGFVFGWKGHEMDGGTGLYFIGGRWYDSETGRFVNAGSADEMLGGAGVVGGLNVYAYALNDGVNAVGESQSIESGYEMESEILCRVEEARRRRRRRRIVAII